MREKSRSPTGLPAHLHCSPFILINAFSVFIISSDNVFWIVLSVCIMRKELWLPLFRVFFSFSMEPPEAHCGIFHTSCGWKQSTRDVTISLNSKILHIPALSCTTQNLIGCCFQYFLINMLPHYRTFHSNLKCCRKPMGHSPLLPCISVHLPLTKLILYTHISKQKK